jgi:hypothetical protein
MEVASPLIILNFVAIGGGACMVSCAGAAGPVVREA